MEFFFLASFFVVAVLVAVLAILGWRKSGVKVDTDAKTSGKQTTTEAALVMATV